MTRMASSLAIDSFNGTKGQELCVFKNELIWLSIKAKDLCFFKHQLMTLVKNSFISYNLFFPRKVNEQLRTSSQHNDMACQSNAS